MPVDLSEMREPRLLTFSVRPPYDRGLPWSLGTDSFASGKDVPRVRPLSTSFDSDRLMLVLVVRNSNSPDLRVEQATGIGRIGCLSGMPAAEQHCRRQRSFGPKRHLASLSPKRGTHHFATAWSEP